MLGCCCGSRSSRRRSSSTAVVVLLVVSTFPPSSGHEWSSWLTLWAWLAFDVVFLRTVENMRPPTNNPRSVFNRPRQPAAAFGDKHAPPLLLTLITYRRRSCHRRPRFSPDRGSFHPAGVLGPRPEVEASSCECPRDGAPPAPVAPHARSASPARPARVVLLAHEELCSCPNPRFSQTRFSYPSRFGKVPWSQQQ